MTIGIKFDDEKPDYSLLPFGAIDEVVKVLTYGAKKYDRDNWKHVESHRYQAAAMRHFSAYMQGNSYDDESGIHHLAHMVTSLLFLLQKDINAKENDVTNLLYNFDTMCYNTNINDNITITFKD